MLGFNFSFMMAEVIGAKGITERGIEGARSKALAAISELKQKKRAEMGWLDLPWQDTSAVKEQAARLRDFENFLLLGI